MTTAATETLNPFCDKRASGPASAKPLSDGSTLPMVGSDDWINLFTAFGAGIRGVKHSEVVANRIRNLDTLPAMAEDMGVLFQQTIKRGGKPAKALLAALGTRAEAPLKWKLVEGTRKDMLRAVASTLLETQKGRNVSLGHLQSSVEDQLRVLSAQGVNLSEKTQFWALGYDRLATEKLAQ